MRDLCGESHPNAGCELNFKEIPLKGQELGTPFDDASRRDLTVNSLFYNVHSKKVEDHTGRGLDDLANKIARTPLPPIQTFHDDPLRVLRCVRFASRFDLSIADDVKDAIRDDEVRVSPSVSSPTDIRLRYELKSPRSASASRSRR